MAKKKRNKKKKSQLGFLFGLALVILFVLMGYILFIKIVLPFYNQYKEKTITVEKPISREEKKQPVIEIKEEEKVEAILYFSDMDAMYLIAEKREIVQEDNMARKIIDELIKGTSDENLYSTIPEMTRVNEVYIAEDIAYVDLSEEIVKNHSGGSSSELMTVYSIVNSLTEMPSIKGVQILVEGKQRESLAGHIDISMPLLRDEKWIKPEIN